MSSDFDFEKKFPTGELFFIFIEKKFPHVTCFHLDNRDWEGVVEQGGGKGTQWSKSTLIFFLKTLLTASNAPIKMKKSSQVGNFFSMKKKKKFSLKMFSFNFWTKIYPNKDSQTFEAAVQGGSSQPKTICGKKLTFSQFHQRQNDLTPKISEFFLLRFWVVISKNMDVDDTSRWPHIGPSLNGTKVGCTRSIKLVKMSVFCHKSLTVEMSHPVNVVLGVKDTQWLKSTLNRREYECSAVTSVSIKTPAKSLHAVHVCEQNERFGLEPNYNVNLLFESQFTFSLKSF